LPDKESAPVAHRPKYSPAKAERELGIQFTPIEVALTDMARAMIDLGIVPRK